MSKIPENLSAVQARIEAACKRAGRAAESVQLLAISKTFPAGRIAEAAAAGQMDFGENYLQEAEAKIEVSERLAGHALRWHFTGPVQANKTAAIAAHFDWVHGVDREKIARRLSEQRPPKLPPLEICIQVKLSDEPGKSGCAPGDAAALCAAVALLPHLRLRGLMSIPPAFDDADDARPCFRALHRLLQDIRAAGAVDAGAFDTLSMGMSGDFEVAIEEGATIVRIGSAIFGNRRRAQPS